MTNSSSHDPTEETPADPRLLALLRDLSALEKEEAAYPSFESFMLSQVGRAEQLDPEDEEQGKRREEEDKQ